MEAENRCTTKDEMETSKAREAIKPHIARATIDEAYDAIEKQMLESIPWPTITNNSKRTRSEWPECMRLFKVIKKLHKSNKNMQSCYQRFEQHM